MSNASLNARNVRSEQQMDESLNGIVGYSMFDNSTLLDDSDSEGISDPTLGSSNEEVGAQIIIPKKNVLFERHMFVESFLNRHTGQCR